MPAKTKWWMCGHCGFQNHPRGAMANSLSAVPSGSEHDNTKCEQCGSSSENENAVDYMAVGRS